MSATKVGLPRTRKSLAYYLTLLIFLLIEYIKQGVRVSTVFLEVVEPSSNVDRAIELLENYSGGRYFVYTHENLTLPDIRARARNPYSRSSWGRKGWIRRFKDFAAGELRFHGALEKCTDSNLRTFNVSEADFVLVPIPLGAVVFWGYASDVEGAFHHLLNEEPFFQEHPEKHVYITNNERLFRHDMIKIFRDCCGFSYEIMEKISTGTLVKDFDPFAFMNYLTDHPEEGWSTQEAIPVFRHYWSIGYTHEASNSKYNLTIASYDDWKNKELIFFYRTTTGTSFFNSTQYRHALFRGNTTEIDKLRQPSAIGFQVEYDQWLKEISNAKFCLIVRGDNPSSRSLFTAIRFGCIPVIVSNALPHYQPIFQSLVSYHDFSIMVDERQFLANPAESINHAIRFLTVFDEEKLIQGLNLVQRLLILDHPNSLFVPAFVHETLTRLRISEVSS